MDKNLVKESMSAYGKTTHRQNLQNLSFPEKVRIVVKLQKIAAPALKARGIQVHPWQND